MATQRIAGLNTAFTRCHRSAVALSRGSLIEASELAQLALESRPRNGMLERVRVSTASCLEQTGHAVVRGAPSSPQPGVLDWAWQRP